MTPLLIRQELLDAIVAHARDELPNECCGLLTGDPHTGFAAHRFALVNALASPLRFESSPESLFAALHAMRDYGEELLAVYHSHPRGPDSPSQWDREMNYSDAVATLIVSFAAAEHSVGVWMLVGDRFVPHPWRVT